MTFKRNEERGETDAPDDPEICDHRQLIKRGGIRRKMDKEKKHKISYTIILALGCLAVLVFIIIKIYNNRKIDSLDGFWTSRGDEHYVAYVHGDIIDIFYYEDREETELSNYNSLYWYCGHFTPPAPGFNRYDWQLEWDYDRSRLPSTWWRSEDSAHIGADPAYYEAYIDMSYKDGKLFRKYRNGSTAFYKSKREYPEILETVAQMDAAKEMVDNGLPVEILSVKAFPKSPKIEERVLETLIFAEVYNPNPYRIRDVGIAFYDEKIDLREADVEDFGGFLYEEARTVLVNWQIWSNDPDTRYKDVIFNEYAVYLPDQENLTVLEKSVKEVNPDGEGNVESVDVDIHIDDTHSYVKDDGTIVYHRPKMSVVFYLDGEIVGGGYCYFDLTDNDMTVNVPVLTVVTDYDDLEVYVY